MVVYKWASTQMASEKSSSNSQQVGNRTFGGQNVMKFALVSALITANTINSYGRVERDIFFGVVHTYQIE